MPRLYRILLGLMILPVLAQEDASIGWDPRETGGFVFDGSFILGELVVAAVLGVLWKAFIRFLETKKASLNWKRIRLWWPTLMLGMGWLTVSLLSRNEALAATLLVLCVFFLVLNLPGILVASVLVEPLRDHLDAPSWLQILVASLIVWAWNYLLVRFAEWRAWAKAPISLDLS